MVIALVLFAGVACDRFGSRADEGLEPPGCATCRITARTVLAFDFTGAPSLPDMATTIALDANHETFVVVADPSRSSFMVFDADGRFVRTIGTGGDGPGEYAAIDALTFDAGDSLWVFDSGNGRADVFGPDLAPARSLPIAGRFQRVVALDDGTFIVPGGGVTDDGVPYAARRLRRDGAIEPFGVPGDDTAVDEQSVLIVSAGRDGVWMAPVRDYTITRWTGRGIHESLIQRAPPWFASWDPVRIAAYEGVMDARPALLDLARDAAGRLWVVGGVLDRDAPDPTTVGGRTDVNVDALFDTVLEIIDPRTGSLVTSARFDFAPPAHLRDGLFYRLVIDVMGVPGLEVLRIDMLEF